jgi:hypothetical protein
MTLTNPVYGALTGPHTTFAETRGVSIVEAV